MTKLGLIRMVLGTCALIALGVDAAKESFQFDPAYTNMLWAMAGWLLLKRPGDASPKQLEAQD